MKIKLSTVFKKDLRIAAFLVGSWAVGLVALYLTNNEYLLGLVPLSNYVAYRFIEERKKEGYREALKWNLKTFMIYRMRKEKK